MALTHDFSEFVSEFCVTNDKPVVVLIDEVDQAGNNDSFVKFLATLSRPWSEAARHPGAFPPAGDAFSELEQLFLEGDGGRFRAVGRAELGEEDREALLDGTGADAEELGDVVVRESARD